MSLTAEEERGGLTLVAILRNEGPYLLEWLAYHRVLGVRDFLLYENGSEDNTPTILRGLAARGLLRWVDWRNPPGPGAQFLAYSEAMAYRRIATPWVAFIDLDEFLVPRRHDSLPALLAGFAPEISGIAVNWTVFGSDGKDLAEPAPVTRRFRHAMPDDLPISRMVKCIVRPERLVAQHIHRSLLTHGRVIDGSGELLQRPGFDLRTSRKAADLLQLNHYIVKSREEFARKLARGSPNRGRPQGLHARIRNWPFFEFLAANATLPDRAIDRFLPDAEAEAARLTELLAAQPETAAPADGAPLAEAADLAQRLAAFDAPASQVWRRLHRKDIEPGEVGAAASPYILL